MQNTAQRCTKCYNTLTMGVKHSCYIPLNIVNKTESIASVLKNSRSVKKLTIKQVASDLSMSFQHIWQIENEVQNVSFELIDKLANYYGIDKHRLAELKLLESKAFKEFKAYVNSLGVK